jgi:type II secretory pathway pseudopilin PulG
MQPKNARREAGYSLIETLLAAGLLAFILVSVSGLFIVGTQNVKSGREMTKATTVANSAMEQVLAWPFEKVYGFPGGVAADSTKQWSTDLANPATTGSAQDMADWAAIADAWRAEVRQQLQGGKLTYKVDGIARLPTALDPGLTSFANAQFLRVTVTVEWVERKQRRRHVTFEEIVL